MPITPAVPVLARDHVRRGAGAVRLRPLLHLADRVPQDALLDRLAVAVQRLELARQPRGLALVVGQQELERGAGMAEPAGRVDPRREPERDRARVDRGGVDAADPHERLQAGLVGSREPSHARGNERAVLVQERDDVGDRRERDEVEMAVEVVHAERLEQLEDDACPAELRERVVGGPRRDDRAVGQRLARPVVVGDDHLQARSARLGDLLDGGDAAVDREHEAHSSSARRASVSRETP